MLIGTHLSIPQVELKSDFVIKSLQEEDQGKTQGEGRPHRHNFFTVIWIHKGSGTHQIDFKDYPIEDNSIHFVSPQQVHWFKSNPGIKGWLFLFNERFIESYGLGSRFLQALGLFTGYTQPEPLFLHQNMFEKLDAYCRAAKNEITELKEFHPDAAAAYLKLFLLECSRIKEKKHVESDLYHSGNRIFQQFMENLELHFQEKHKVADYAELQHITPNYLNEVVKESSGISAKEHILKRITLEAMRFATHSDINTKETAYILGFEDPSHFSKFFKKRCGVDFTGFRESLRYK